MPKKSPPTTSEAHALKSALRRLPGSAKNRALADHLGVDPSFVSQWATGHRPMPSKYALSAAEFLGVNPDSLSADYADEINRHGGESAGTPADVPAVVAELQAQLDALSVVAAALLSTMTKYRPVEAEDAASKARQLVGKKARIAAHPLLRELLAVMESPPKAKRPGAKSA